MEPYTVRFWDNTSSDLENAVGTMFTVGIINLVPDPPLAYKCEITDTDTGEIGITEEWMPNKMIAHNVALANLATKLRTREEEINKLREKELRYARPERNSEETDLSATLIKWAIYVALFFGAVWLAFAVALPLVLINCALISLVAGFFWYKGKNYLFWLSLAGTIFILFDYNKGWLTKTLVTNVSFFGGFIPFFLYINIAAGLIASYFLIRDFMNERYPPLAGNEEFSKRNIIIMASLLALGCTVIGLQRYTDSKTVAGYDNTSQVTQVATTPVSSNTGNSNNQTVTIVDTVKKETARIDTVKINNSAPGNLSEVYSKGHFSGDYFEVTVPSDFTVRPSIKTKDGTTYDSAFFTSPDGEVEFYIFSPLGNEEAYDLNINPNIEKTISTSSQPSSDKIITWSEYKALDGSYLRAYQYTREKSGRLISVIGLKYKSQEAYKKYKQTYLSFKKSYTLTGD